MIRLRLGNDFPASFTLALTLKSRERIEASVSLIVLGKPTGRLFNPFSPDDRYRDFVFRTVAPLTEARANRWALSLPSAEDALDTKMYDALEGELLSIQSPDFKVRWVCVHGIVPLTHRLPKEVVPPPQEPPIDRFFREMTQDATNTVSAQHLEQMIYDHFPILTGPSKHAEGFRARFFDKTYDILLNRRKKNRSEEDR